MEARVDAAMIAQACGFDERTVRQKWSSAPDWPRGEAVGRQHRMVWPVSALPEVLVRRGRAIRVRERVQVWLALRGEGAQTPSAPAGSDAPGAPAAAPTAKAAPRTEASYQAAWARYERLTDAFKDRAKERLQALYAVHQLVSGGLPRSDAIDVVADRVGVAPGTVWRWWSAVRKAPRQHWLPLLVPQYQGRCALVDIPTEAWDLFRADYLRPEAPAAAACYDRVQRIARQHGWQLPSLRTFQRRIDDIPRRVRVLAREGVEALDRMYPAQARLKDGFTALEAVNADGHRFDVFVRWPDGTVARPTMVAWQDLYSGMILGYRVTQTESADTVRLAFRDVVERYGIPRHAWLDNGRGFASKWITGGTRTRYRFRVREEDPQGLLVALGVEVHWTTPYRGQAKPIERAFRDVCEYVGKHPAFSGAYTGRNPTAKPENYRSRAIPLDQFLAVLADEIRAHNAREGRRSAVCAGRSFERVFAESYAGAPVRKATAEQLRTLLLAAEAVTAHRADGSVHLLGNRYWTEALAGHAGQRLVVRFDPDALQTQVSVYTLDGDYIADAECVMAVGFADTQAATEHARARKQHRRAAKAQLAAERRMRVAEMAAQLPSTAPADLPQAQVVEMLPAPRKRQRAEPEEGGLTESERQFGALMERGIEALKKRML
jgi:putative transposase